MAIGGGVTMSYGFSATTKAFYVYEDKESYEANGNWPEDVKPVSDQVWEKYCMQGPEGKERGANKRGLPCWVDIPAPTKETQTAAANWKKGLLLEKAGKAIAPLQDADDLGIASEAEKAALLAWKKYRVLLNRIDVEHADKITWPEVPSVA